MYFLCPFPTPFLFHCAPNGSKIGPKVIVEPHLKFCENARLLFKHRVLNLCEWSQKPNLFLDPSLSKILKPQLTVRCQSDVLPAAGTWPHPATHTHTVYAPGVPWRLQGSPSRAPERAPKENLQNGPFSDPPWRGSSELPSRREHRFHRFSRVPFGTHFGVILGASWDPWAPLFSPKSLRGPPAGPHWGLHLPLRSLSGLPWRPASFLIWLPASPESPEGPKMTPK